MNERTGKKIFGKYIELLSRWQEKINLVGTGTMGELWPRHFEDSLYLYDFLAGARDSGTSGGWRMPNAGAGGRTNAGPGTNGGKRILDIGAGAGFPGMVLAIAGIRNLTLIEADGRKCAFLNEIKRTYDLDVKIINGRVENLEAGYADSIIGRAFAPLEKIFTLCGKLILPTTKFYLLKGSGIREEIASAKTDWNFDYKLHDKPGGYILEIQGVDKKCFT